MLSGTGNLSGAGGDLGVRGWGIDIGDEAAFERFVRARGQAHARTAVLLLGDHQLGEDLVQEVLARIAVRWRAVSQVQDLDAYVHRALVNTAVSWRRRRSFRERPQSDLPEQPMEVVHGDEAVLRALRLLPPRQRAVVVLRHYVDRSEQQTALLLGCSVGTVKSQNAKALARLRVLLTQDLETT